jgi:hypothetical protein
MSAPQNVVATVIESGKVSVSWTTPTNLPQEKYYYAVHSIPINPSDPVFGKLTSSDNPTTSCILSDINVGSSYKFAVRMISFEDGPSDAIESNTVSF